MSSSGPKLHSVTRVVGNDHFCDTTKRASQRQTPHIQAEIPLYHRSGNKPLDSTTLLRPVLGTTSLWRSSGQGAQRACRSVDRCVVELVQPEWQLQGSQWRSLSTGKMAHLRWASQGDVDTVPSTFSLWDQPSRHRARGCCASPGSTWFGRRALWGPDVVLSKLAVRFRTQKSRPESSESLAFGGFCFEMHVQHGALMQYPGEVLGQRSSAQVCPARQAVTVTKGFEDFCSVQVDGRVRRDRRSATTSSRCQISSALPRWTRWATASENEPSWHAQTGTHVISDKQTHLAASLFRLSN